MEITEEMGDYAYGAVGASVLIYRAELVLTGYNIHDRVTTTEDIDFSEDPFIIE